jgi:hypothetical protein
LGGRTEEDEEEDDEDEEEEEELRFPLSFSVSTSK